MARTAIALGHEYMVLTDHSPRLTIAHGLTAERLQAQLDEVDALNERLAPFRILTGIEVDILADGALDQSEELLAARRGGGQRPLEAAMERHGDDPPDGDRRGQPPRRHPRALHRPQAGRDGAGRHRCSTPRSCSPRAPSSTPRWRSTAGPSARTRPTTCSSWRSTGTCRFAIDTDAHAPGQMEWQAYGCDKAARHGIDAGPDRQHHGRRRPGRLGRLARRLRVIALDALALTALRALVVQP